MNEVKCGVEDEASYTPEQKVNVLLVLNNEAVTKKKTTLLMFGMKWLILNQSSRAACVAVDILTLNMFLKNYVELYEHQSIEKYANF